MLKGVKVQLYPSEDQVITINKLLGSMRFVYNNCLKLQSENYEVSGNTYLNLTKVNQHIIGLKNQDEFGWLKESNSKVVVQTLMDLDAAFQNFFKKRGGYPNFKSKGKTEDSCRFPKGGISRKGIIGNRINLIKGLMDIHFKCSKRDEITLNDKENVEIRSATLTKSKSNKYFLSILLKLDDVKYQPVIKQPMNSSIGIDLGITHFITTSKNERYSNIKSIRSNSKKLKKLNRRHSKKQNKSKNKEKARIKLAKEHEKIKNRKNNMLHKVSKKLIDENQIIGMEDLNVKGMLKNHCLAKSISELSLGEFKRQMKYKSDWYGRDLIVVDRYFPSSKQCNVCKQKNHNLKLSQREWTCSCGEHHDRDVNAGINLELEAIRIHETSNNIKPKPLLLIKNRFKPKYLGDEDNKVSTSSAEPNSL